MGIQCRSGASPLDADPAGYPGSAGVANMDVVTIIVG